MSLAAAMAAPVAQQLADWMKSSGGFNNQSMLAFACFYNQPEVVRTILEDATVNVNLPDDRGVTPLMRTCNRGHRVLCLEILLLDARVDVNFEGYINLSGTDSEQHNCLSVAASQGHEALVHRILAGLHHIHPETVELALQHTSKGPIAGLLLAYQKDQFNTVKELRIQLGLTAYGPVSVFVPLVLLCDQYFVCGRDGKPGRFFTMLARLPMELQMIACNRLFGLRDVFINSKLFECALRIFVTNHGLK